MNEEIIQDRRSRSRDDNIDGASSSTRERNLPIVPVSCSIISIGIKPAMQLVPWL